MGLLFQFFVHKKMLSKKTLNKSKKNLQQLCERASFELPFDTIFITVGKKLVNEIDFENLVEIYHV